MKVTRQILLIGVLLLAAIFHCSECLKANDLDWLADIEDETLDDLPAGAARGFQRSLLGSPKVIVGYSINAHFRVPDISTKLDALPQFNRAMDKVVSNGGGFLLIENGTYIFSGQFAIRCSNCEIRGAGMSKTVLKLADKAVKFRGVGFVTGRRVTTVTIRALTLDGNKKNQIDTQDAQYGRYGLFISPNENLRLDKIKVINFQQYGIDPPARNVIAGVDYSNSTKRSLTVTNCVANNNNYDGFIFDTVVGVYAANNIAEGNGRYGMNLVTGTWNALVVDNIFRNNGFGSNAKDESWRSLGGNGCGVAVDSNMLDKVMYISTNIVLQKNTVINSARGGFCSKLSKNVVMTQNTIIQAPQCAWLYQNLDVTFTNNTCQNTTTYIINQENKKSLVSGNTCGGKAC